jgi:hypothetical protein
VKILDAALTKLFTQHETVIERAKVAFLKERLEDEERAHSRTMKQLENERLLTAWLLKVLRTQNDTPPGDA